MYLVLSSLLLTTLLVGTNGLVKDSSGKRLVRYFIMIAKQFDCNKVLYLHDGISDVPHLFRNANMPYYNIQNCSLFSTFDHNCYIISYVPRDLLEGELHRMMYKVNYKRPKLVVFLQNKHWPDLDVFRLMWKYYLINVVLVARNLTMYTYKPLSGGHCKNIRPIQLTSLKGMRLQSKLVKFPNCTLRIIRTSQMPFTSQSFKEGLDEHVVTELMRRLHLTPDFAYFLDTLIIKNGNGSYAWDAQTLFDHKTDIYVGGTAYSQNIDSGFRNFDKTYVHAFGGGAFYTPFPSEVSPWKNPIRIFQYDVWTVILVSFIFTTIIYYSLGERDIFMTYRILLSSVPAQPQVATSRIVFVFSFLFRRKLEKALLTLEDIVSSGIEFGGHVVGKSTFISSDNLTRQYIFQNYQSCPPADKTCYHRLFVSKDFVLSRTDRVMNYVLNQHKSFRAHMMTPNIYHYFTLLMSKGSPFSQRMAELVILFWDVGLIEKWDKYRSTPTFKEQDNINMPITMQHLYLTCGLYLVGLIMSLIIFVWECRAKLFVKQT